ncbi:hypothetical protein HOK09_02985 [Candidatus Woesearchaeota archaeon]|jgi:hypothetical protein|nr:hypothetical protein [Candidatus Woesearchaeota archaeon]
MKKYTVKERATGISYNSNTKSGFDFIKINDSKKFVFSEMELVEIKENEFDFSKIYSFNMSGKHLMFREADLEFNLKEK